jgi:hypothetical protein
MTLEQVRQSISLMYIISLYDHDVELAKPTITNVGKQLECFERLSLILSKYDLDFFSEPPKNRDWFYDVALILKIKDRQYDYISITVSLDWNSIEEFYDPRYVFNFFKGKHSCFLYTSGTRISKEDILDILPELVFVIDELV